MWLWVALALAGSAEPGKKAEWWYTGPTHELDGTLVAPVDPVARAAWAKVAVRYESPSARWAIYDLGALQASFGERVQSPRPLAQGRWLAVPPGGKERVTALFEGEPPGEWGYLVESWTLSLGEVVRLGTDGPALPFGALPLGGDVVRVEDASCAVLSSANGRTRDYLGNNDVMIVTSTVEATLELACTNHGDDWLLLRPLRAKLGGPQGTAPRGGPVAAVPPGGSAVVPILFPHAASSDGSLWIEGVVVRPAQTRVALPPLTFAKDPARSRD